MRAVRGRGAWAAVTAPMVSAFGWVIFSGCTGVGENFGLGTRTFRPVAVAAQTDPLATPAWLALLAPDVWPFVWPPVLIMLGMMIPTANTVVTAARGWGPKSFAGLRSTSPPRRTRLRVQPYIIRATFWRSDIPARRHVRKSGATVTPDACEVKRENRWKSAYREVPETENSVLSGPIRHLSVILSAHSVGGRTGATGG